MVEENPELVRERHREVERASRAKRVEENPGHVREKHREADRICKGSTDVAIKNFHKEKLYGPVFDCVCCKILFFRPQVVEYDKPNRVQIRKQSAEAQIRDYNDRAQQVYHYTHISPNILWDCDI